MTKWLLPLSLTKCNGESVHTGNVSEVERPVQWSGATNCTTGMCGYKSGATNSEYGMW